MKKETEETAAWISVYDFARVCKEVDQEFEAAFASIFAQKRTYAKAAAYADALAAPGVAVKTSWDIAEYAGYGNPGPVQSLVRENKWDSEDLWKRIAITADEALGVNDPGDPLGRGMVIDETAQEKRGTSTAGVSHQYAGCAGRVINCTTWVMMSLIAPGVRTWVSGCLFLPRKTWFTGDGETGDARCAQAGVPEETVFMSKPELARQQFAHARKIGIKFSWGGGDEVYGRYKALRDDHEDNNEAYAYFVPRNHVVTMLSKERRRVDELLSLADGRYELRSAGPGVNGPRYYDWAMIGVESPNHFLLIRKPVFTERGLGGAGQDDAAAEVPAACRGESRAASGKSGKEKGKDRVKDEAITFCLCCVPDGSPIKPTMTNLVLMAGGRWGAEESMATAKGPIGWDENQFRKWESLRRHTALAGLAMLKANMIAKRVNALSAVAGASGERQENTDTAAQECIFPEIRGPESDVSAAALRIPIGDAAVPHSPDQKIPRDIGFIRLSVNEVLHLRSIVLAGLSEARMAFHIRWSNWRRKHQAIARWYHRLARIKVALEADGNLGLEGIATLRNRCFEDALCPETSVRVAKWLQYVISGL